MARAAAARVLLLGVVAAVVHHRAVAALEHYCPPGWSMYLPARASTPACYAQVGGTDGVASLDQARALCQPLGGGADVVSISSAEENSFVKQLCGRYCLIGLLDEEQSGHTSSTWVDGATVRWTNWGTFADKSLPCVWMQNEELWSSTSCSGFDRRVNSVCKRESIQCAQCLTPRIESLPCSDNADRQCVCDEGSREVDMECQACLPGTYQDELGKTTCKPCAPGSMQPEHMATSCVACNVSLGQFQDESGQEACDQVSTCNFEAEYVALAPGASWDRVCKTLTACTSEQFEVLEPTRSSDRQCRGFDVKPRFQETVYDVTVPAGAPAGTVAVRLTTQPSTQRVTLSSDLPTTSYLQLTADGTVLLARDHTSVDPEVVLFEVTATEVLPAGRSNCVLKPEPGQPIVVPPEGSGGCSATTFVRLVAVGFQNCPADMVALLPASGSNGLAKVTWTPPSLSDQASQYKDQVTASHEPGISFSYGTTEVSYTLSVDQFTFECNFKVTVASGILHSLPQVTSQMVPISDGGSLVYNYLVDDTDAAGRIPNLPSFTNNVLDVGFVLHMSPAEAGEKIAVAVPPGSDFVRLEVNVAFCASGVELALSSLQPLTPTVTFGPTTTPQPTFVNSGSGMMGNGHCFLIRGATSAITSAMQLDFIRISLPKLSSQGFVSGNEMTYFSVRGFPNDVHFAASVRGVEPTQFFVSVDDVLDPQFRGCPRSLSVTAEKGALGATVTWVAPVAVDNVGVVDFSSTHQPDTFFKIEGSPHQVVYTARDNAGHVSTCKFSVTVDWVPQVADLSSITLERNLKTEVTTSPFGTVVHRSLLVTAEQFPAVNFLAITSTALRMNMFSAPGDVITIWLPRNSATRIVVDGIFALGGNRVNKALSDGTSFTEVTPLALRDPQGNLLTWSPNWFESSEDTFFQLWPPLARLSGSSVVLQTVFPFEYITVEGLRFQLSSPAAAGVQAGRRQRRGPYDVLTVDGSAIAIDNVLHRDPAQPLDTTLLENLVTVADVFKPVFVTCPSSPDGPIATMVANVTASSATARVVWDLPVAEDNRDGRDVVMTYPPLEHQPGSQFPIGTTHIKYTATDAANNTAVCEFVVEVRDYFVPELECSNATMVLQTLPSVAVSQAVNLTMLAGFVKAKDNTGVVDVGIFPARPLTLNDTHINVVARDSFGNEARCRLNVSVVDVEPPRVTCPQDHVVSTDKQGGDSVTYPAPSADDNDGIASIVTTVPSGSRFLVGRTPVTVTATDRSGNSKQCTFNVALVSTAAAPSSGGSSSSTVGIAAGAVVAVVLILLVGAVYMRRRLRQSQQPATFEHILELLHSTVDPENGPKRPREINRAHVKLLGELGKGNFGSVQRGLLDEKILGMPAYLVAIKLLKNSDSGDKNALLEEAALMAQFDHPHCVGLIGVVTVGEPLMVLLEFCEYGSLGAYLHKYNLPEAEKLLIAADSASGLAYLASRGFVHRDVAARNVLISSEKRGKISDFGLSRDTDQELYYQSRGGAMPVRWTAPEALDQRKFSQKTDVWAFGILLFEIWTDADLPYKGWNNQRVWVEVENGYRLPQPEGCKADVYQLMKRCWASEPSARPQFKDLHEQLRELHETAMLTMDAPDAPERTPSTRLHAYESTSGSSFNSYLSLLGENERPIDATDELEAVPVLHSSSAGSVVAPDAAVVTIPGSVRGRGSPLKNSSVPSNGVLAFAFDDEDDEDDEDDQDTAPSARGRAVSACQPTPRGTSARDLPGFEFAPAQQRQHGKQPSMLDEESQVTGMYNRVRSLSFVAHPTGHTSA